MSQSRISSFFTGRIADPDYQAQVQRDSAEHDVARQEAAIQQRENQARKRLREQQNNTTNINSSSISLTTTGDINVGR